MAENMPNIPTGAVPPKKETGKVQPKKETVRINLPPKPSAAPTIKMPTLPPGGPTGAPGKPIGTPAPTAAAAPAAPPPPRSGAAAPMAPRSAMPPQQRVGPVVAPAAATVKPIDKVLAIAALVIGLVAIGSTAWLAYMF